MVVLNLSIISLSFAALAASSPTRVLARQATPSPSQSCTPSYASRLNDTNGVTFQLEVSANSALYDLHNVQFRNATATSLGDADSGSVVVVDKASTVLSVTLNNGTLSATKKDPNGENIFTGTVAGLRDVTISSNHTLQSFVVRSIKGAPTAFQESQSKWYLQGGVNTPRYFLYQEVPQGWSGSWLICPTNATSGDFQLFWAAFYQTLNFYPGCEYMALSVSYPPFALRVTMLIDYL